MVTGPNGAGKSTLMKAIAGLVKPRQGRIVFDGQLTTGRAPETVAASGFSLVPEGRQVFGSMTVLENLRIGTGLRRNALAVAADLEYLLDVFPLLRERAHGQAGLLSGGQQQMLVIARALMAAPRLLAIDEPSLGLAPRVTDQVYEALLRLRAERDLTLLIVEQSASRALLTGGRMVMLREGGIVLEGDPRQITAQQMQQAYFGYDAAPAAMHA
jgi:branched-chain amino acid transport system ATP-binding protein